MIHTYFNLPLEKMLLQFMTEDDPMLSMFKWFCEKLMEAEVNAKINAAKSERTDERSGYRSGYRVRHYDICLGIIIICSQTKKGWLYFLFCHREKILRNGAFTGHSRNLC